MSLTSTQKALLHAGALLIAWALLFQTTLFDLISAWQNSDTFQHCFMIAPIVLWLLWRRRFMLAEVHFKPISWLLIPTLFSGALWYAGNLTGIQIVAQFAAIGWLFFSVWSSLGNGFFKVAWFPMCYLFFMLPLGDEIVPQLQVITADISVLLLSWSGIPVFREGLYIAIPNGLFEVAVACSGIRYLIASIALGTLFAHLQFHSLKRQFIFVIIAAIVPIIANGVRAYFIVLIAHLSDMQLATGVDHLLYGWIFFGMVMFLLFWLGSFWREAKADPITQVSQPGSWQHPSKALVIIGISITSMWATLVHQKHVSELGPPSLSLNQTALRAIFSPSELSAWQPRFANADDYFTGTATFSGLSVELYVAFYKQNRQGKELINYTHQLYNMEIFTPEKHETIVQPDSTVGRYQLTGTSGQKFQIHYWYQLADLKSSSHNKVKLSQAWKKLTSQQDAGAVIILATQEHKDAQQALEQEAERIMEAGQLW